MHVTFDGTRGTLRRGKITVGPPGRVTASENQINVFLSGSLAAGMPLCLTVWSESESITVHTALWSADFNIVGTAEVVGQVSELPRVNASNASDSG